MGDPVGGLRIIVFITVCASIGYAGADTPGAILGGLIATAVAVSIEGNEELQNEVAEDIEEIRDEK